LLTSLFHVWIVFLSTGNTSKYYDQVHAVVGVLSDDTDPMVTVMKLEKAPTESYADIGGMSSVCNGIRNNRAHKICVYSTYRYRFLNVRNA
jgi:ATP-dependent 26S proteasome regulatory subunit